MIPQMGKQLCYLNYFLLAQRFSYFKGGHDGYIKNKSLLNKRETPLFKGGRPKLSEIIKICQLFND